MVSIDSGEQRALFGRKKGNESTGLFVKEPRPRGLHTPGPRQRRGTLESCFAKAEACAVLGGGGCMRV